MMIGSVICLRACLVRAIAHLRKMHIGPLLVLFGLLISGQALAREFSAPKKKKMAETILRYQRANGGWPKNYDRSGAKTDGKVVAGMEKNDTTFDNGATHTEVKLLAGFYRETGDERFRRACLRGVEFMLSAQYANGGWPQFFRIPKAIKNTSPSTTEQ
jgi:hypothetical protein